MKKILVLLSVLALLGAASCTKDDKDNRHGPEWQNTLPSGPDQIKVLTFNIRQKNTNATDRGMNYWALRAGACRDMVIDQQPTVLGLQELAQTQWEYMSGTLAPYGYDGKSMEGHKNGFLYKKDVVELLRDGRFWASATPEVESMSWDDKYTRPVQWAEFRVKATGQGFFFMTTHLGLTSQSRLQSMKLIKKRIEMYNTENLPVVLMADFNTIHTDKIFDEIKETMYCTRDVAPITDDVKTYNAWAAKGGEPYICDHIFVSNSLGCPEYRTVTKPYDGHTLISDHYPCYSIVQF